MQLAANRELSVNCERRVVMPYEILYNSLDELEKKLEGIKEKGVKIEKCIIKVNKDNVKLKIRAKHTLYTAVLDEERTGKNKDELEQISKELAKKIGCEEPEILS